MHTVVHAFLIALALSLSTAAVSATSDNHGLHGPRTGPASPALHNYDLAGTSRDGTARPRCHMAKPRPIIQLDEGSSDTCETPPTGKWTKAPLGALDLFVNSNGPGGSGRYWLITIGVAKRNQPAPTHHSCLTTSTLGWRTLRKYKNGPLPWHGDLDNDGKAELIIWNSFGLRKEAPYTESGLMAWVYRYAAEYTFEIDLRLSRRMAREIANAYRTPLDPGKSPRQDIRIQFARTLETFSKDHCVLNSGGTP